ncbi:MAG: NlpC/P60 family protein [Alphaproteobacteria bacterium]|jgi:cell wall-associated NlpC family hydrolase|nr:NlpC/P60 family protein [Alphaproteobacteria bacterium]
MTQEESIEAMVQAVIACLGTPFHHQGRKAGVGLDCIGLVIIGANAAGIAVRDRRDYGRRPDGVSLVQALKDHGAQEVPDRNAIRRGDILLFRYDGQPQHVALALRLDEMIHSFAPAGKVVQSTMGDYWRRRLVGVYRFTER